VAVLRLIRTVSAVTVDGTRLQPFQVDVPDVIGIFGKLDALDPLAAVLVKQAEFDLRSVCREN
jgi:hypothetical protein